MNQGRSLSSVAARIICMTLALAMAGEAVSQEARRSGIVDMVWVKKSENLLMLVKDFQIIRSYPVSLGRVPVGHKRREGDGRTPEGLYYIDGRNPNSRYYLALQVSYPNGHDRRLAEERGESPGGEIMIHGEPNHLKKGEVLARNWTQGCIAVSNQHMRELWSAVADGTPVLIEP